MKRLLIFLIASFSVASGQQINPSQVKGTAVVQTPSGTQAIQGPISSPSVNNIKYVDGVTYTTIQQAIDSFGAPGNCGIVQIPQGTYTANLTFNTSNTCTDPSLMLILRGAGLGNTVIKPATNSCVITIDSTAGPVQNLVIEDLMISNNGTGFSGSNNNGICFKGNNINDHHLIRRVNISGGFYNNVLITGRTIWTNFEDDTLNSSANTNFLVNNDASHGLVGLLVLERVAIDGATNGACIYINTSTATNTGIAIRDSTAQDCSQYGAELVNIDGLDVTNSDFEANGSSGTFPNIYLAGFARGFSIRANHMLGSTTGAGIEINTGAEQMNGDISGNYIGARTASVQVDPGTSSGVVSIGCNFDASTGHSISADSNGSYHAVNTCTGGQIVTDNASTGSIAPSVTGISNLSFTNASPATVTNFTGGDPGQIISVYNNSTSTVTFTHSNSNGLYMPGGVSFTISGGQMCQFLNQPTKSRWVAFGCTNLTVDASPTVGNAACIKSVSPVVIGYCSTTVGAGGACTCN
jgi:hypothetical protein